MNKKSQEYCELNALQKSILSLIDQARKAGVEEIDLGLIACVGCDVHFHCRPMAACPFVGDFDGEKRYFGYYQFFRFTSYSTQEHVRKIILRETTEALLADFDG